MYASGRSGTRCVRLAQTFIRGKAKVAMAGEVDLSNKRIMRKIAPGKARPAIFHQFETLVELSDGSVVKRRSQAPKDEIRMITDQRNHPLWNPFRSDLNVVDPNATGRRSRFQAKYAEFSNDASAPIEEGEPVSNKPKASEDFLELLGQNAKEVQKGGQIFNRKAASKK
ncbi:uncharacterized protein KQ657_000159 [Scheffersomyces spartinae]|uniref:Ribosomal protein bL31m N-terminal domain-containing protein n=1 Tax=Scheffersomyces spartinae TaxID=45513 RepID=A0A9P7VE59_9ASCO|nr:uncharacterized protein KQ657_000159 [Scheffersomyces spartinae]KAG7196147.1 hypothetical protein KQ657_000159 [Scheffersomyces spartinae]